MKQNQNKFLRMRAKQIAMLEKEIDEGKNIQENKKKIEEYMLSLNFEDMLWVDNYIQSHKL